MHARPSSQLDVSKNRYLGNNPPTCYPRLTIPGVTHGMRKGCAWFHERLTRYITRSITSRNAYIDALILAVLWPVRTESIHLRPSAVLSRDPRPTLERSEEAGKFG
jgi:hypothetical protein